jgi:fructan beta-fructosidase
LVQQPDLPVPPHQRDKSSLTLAEANARLADRNDKSGVFLLRAKLELGAASEVGIRLRRNTLNAEEPASEETVIGIDTAKGKIFVDRNRSGYVEIKKNDKNNPDSSDFPARTVAPLKHPEAKTVSIEIIADRSSIEVFAEDGETVLTNLIFPYDDSQGMAFYATGAPSEAQTVHIHDLELVPLK